MKNPESNEIIRMSVCLASDDSAWRSLLESEGLEYQLLSDGASTIGSPVLILPQHSPLQLRSLAFKVLNRGGTIIAEPGTLESLDSSRKEITTYPYHRTDFTLSLSSEVREMSTIDIRKVENGTLILLPFCLAKIWSDRRCERKYFNIADGNVSAVWENLPKITRKNVRIVIMDLLWRAHRAAEVPLVQKWYWPNGARSFFSFRADMDAGDDLCLSCFIDTIRPWSKSLSLFVCGKAYVDKGYLLKQVADLKAEIGNHTYTHYVFSDKERNRKNLELTEKLLAPLGVVSKGYVGPASFWHSSMYDVLEGKGYDYTSSFGLDHDNFPYFPSKNDSETYNMLEIPFHCLGDRFPKFGLSLNSLKVANFFDQLIEKKYHLCEPMFIYGHPDMQERMGAHPQLVKRICEKALSFNDVATGNMSDIAVWWRRRHKTKANIEFDQENRALIAKKYRADNDVFWSIQIADDCKYLVSDQRLQVGVSLDSLYKFKKIDLTNAPHANIGEVVDRPSEKLGIRSRLGDFQREIRRKKKMIRELNSASLRLS